LIDARVKHWFQVVGWQRVRTNCSIITLAGCYLHRRILLFTWVPGERSLAHQSNRLYC